MDIDEQIYLVREMCDRIRDECVQRIRAGDVPTDWNGIELRWWLADKFEFNSFGRGKNADSSYKARYRRFLHTERERDLV